MGISEYPRYGFRLAPLALKEILDIYAPKHLVKQENTKLFELNESSWERFGSDNCLTLSEIILKRCNAFFFLMPAEITGRHIPQFSQLDNLQNIELENPTLDCLEKSFANKKVNLSKLTIGKLLNFRCLGMRGLIDLLTSLESLTSNRNFELNNKENKETERQHERNVTNEEYSEKLSSALKVITDDCNYNLFNVPEWIKKISLPELSQNFNFEKINLQKRTKNCFLRIGIWYEPHRLKDFTIDDLLRVKNFGFRSLLDLLSKLEIFLRSSVNDKDYDNSIFLNDSKFLEDKEVNYYDTFVKALHIIETNFERRTRKYPKWVGKMKMPQLPEEFDYFELGLKIRTENALNRIEVWEDPQRLSNKTIRDLLTLKNFGVLSLLDLMKNLEPYVKQFHSNIISETIRIDQKPLFESISYQPSLSQQKRKINSVELKAEVTKLLEIEFCNSIKSNDFRFGHLVRGIDKKAEDISGLATRLLNDENIPTDNTKTLSLLKELREKISTIQEMKLEDELESYLQSVKIERDKKIISKRFGLNGNGLSTLQTIGDEFQVTRERIRQICKKWTDKLQESSVFVPKIEDTIKFITKNTPNSCSVIMEKLVAEGITRKPFQLENIKELADLFKVDYPFMLKEVDGIIYILSDASEMTVNLIHKKARKAIEHWGTSTIEEITSQVIEENQNISSEFIEQVLTSKEDFSWLDKGSGWFWLKSVPRNRLYNQMRKVLSVADKIDISELRAGISRHHRTRSLSPPKRVLLEFCKQTNLGRIENGLIISDNKLNWEKELSTTEQFMVLILKENSNVMRRVDLEKLCVELGMSNPAFQVSLSYSPIIVKFGVGVYGLRGNNIPIGLIESITNSTSKRRGRVLKDFGWKNNDIWIAYQLSESAIKSGVIGVPASVKDYIEGEFRLRTEENQTVGRIVIREASAWGFSAFFRRRGGEIGDYMLLLFNTRSMEITIHIGDEDLIEEFQDADS